MASDVRPCDPGKSVKDYDNGEKPWRNSIRRTPLSRLRYQKKMISSQ